MMQAENLICLWIPIIDVLTLQTVSNQNCLINGPFLTQKIPSSGDGADFTPSLDSCKHFN